jgi:hypothetical protein
MPRTDYLKLMGAKPARNDAEARLQAAIIEHIKLRVRKGVLWFHVPNGEHRSKSTGAKLKRMGVRPGVADLVFVLPPNGEVCFLELKADAGRPSDAQLVFADACEAAGATYAIAWDLEHALTLLEAWRVIKQESRL